jgi:signal peptidase I
MRGWFHFLAWVGGLVAAVLALLYATLFDVWTLPTDDPLFAASVEPTLSAGDVVVVLRHGSVGRSDLVRCADPQAPGRFVVARAIARSGEQVDIAGEVVSVDRRRTPSPRACESPRVTLHNPNTDQDVDLVCAVEDYGGSNFEALRAASQPEPTTSATVESGLWYLVSDDRHVHLDSRDFGQVSGSTCQHVVFRFVSAAGFGDAKKRLTFVW